MKPPVLVLHVTGTNRDREAAWACELAGGAPEIVHINQLRDGSKKLLDYRMLVLPGGFSYGDDLGAGKLWSVLLQHQLAEDLALFIDAGRPVIGICNGFQALVKSGILPGQGKQQVTLTRNDSAKFECRWVHLAPEKESPCVFTAGLVEPIFCPVAHGEGKLVAQDSETLQQLETQGLVALRYTHHDTHNAAQGGGAKPVAYPENPNGSQGNIAGICNQRGNVLGLMPHPEDHILDEQHPGFHRGVRGMSGLPLFRNGVQYAKNL